MPEKNATIVIKKITVVSGGAHGGAWKVAFADFMTAMMAFFLVMWLIATSSEAEKKAVSDYFSTPSVIEYQFQNFGVELTLEKLFLDLINEPLKTLDGFITPMEKKPNILSFGMKKVVMSYMADQLGDVANEVQVTADTVVFEIPDNLLFEYGTARPAPKFVSIMEKVRGVTGGLQDSELVISSVVYRQSVSDKDSVLAKEVADQRLDIIQNKVKAGLEKSTVDIVGHASVKNDDRGPKANQVSGGYVRFEAHQKQVKSDGKKPRPMTDSVFGSADTSKNVYDNFVDQVANRKKNSEKNDLKREAAREVGRDAPSPFAGSDQIGKLPVPKVPQEQHDDQDQ